MSTYFDDAYDAAMMKAAEWTEADDERHYRKLLKEKGLGDDDPSVKSRFKIGRALGAVGVPLGVATGVMGYKYMDSPAMAGLGAALAGVNGIGAYLSHRNLKKYESDPEFRRRVNLENRIMRDDFKGMQAYMKDRGQL